MGARGRTLRARATAAMRVIYVYDGNGRSVGHGGRSDTVVGRTRWTPAFQTHEPFECMHSSARVDGACVCVRVRVACVSRRRAFFFLSCSRCAGV